MSRADDLGVMSEQVAFLRTPVRAPASVSAVIMLLGLALMYWSASGLGIIGGANVQEKLLSVKPKLETRDG